MGGKIENVESQIANIETQSHLTLDLPSVAFLNTLSNRENGHDKRKNDSILQAQPCDKPLQWCL